MPAELCVVNNGAEYDSCKKCTHLSTRWSEHIEELFKQHGILHGEFFPKIIQEYSHKLPPSFCTLYRSNW